jgi:hypothetical protein
LNDFGLESPIAVAEVDVKFGQAKVGDVRKTIAIEVAHGPGGLLKRR